jgi:hypothetical protein
MQKYVANAANANTFNFWVLPKTRFLRSDSDKCLRDSMHMPGMVAVPGKKSIRFHEPGPENVADVILLRKRGGFAAKAREE